MLVLPTPAAWDVFGVGSYVWHDGALGRVHAKGHADATIAVFTGQDERIRPSTERDGSGGHRKCLAKDGLCKGCAKK